MVADLFCGRLLWLSSSFLPPFPLPSSPLFLIGGKSLFSINRSKDFHFLAGLKMQSLGRGAGRQSGEGGVVGGLTNLPGGSHFNLIFVFFSFPPVLCPSLFHPFIFFPLPHLASISPSFPSAGSQSSLLLSSLCPLLLSPFISLSLFSLLLYPTFLSCFLSSLFNKNHFTPSLVILSSFYYCPTFSLL